MIKTSKEGKIFISPFSGRKYRVYKYKEFENGNIIALEKKEVKTSAKK